MVRRLPYYQSRETPQRSKALPNQVQMESGGYAFKIDNWKALERILTLGTEGGTYYVGEKALTAQAISIMEACLVHDPQRFCKMLEDYSINNRALKQDVLLFGLAMAANHDEYSAFEAYLAARKMLRTPSQLFEFFNYLYNYFKRNSGFKRSGAGAGLRRMVGDFYNDPPLQSTMYHVLKYRSRNGWTHRDVLHLCHVKPNEERKALFDWIFEKTDGNDIPYVAAYNRMHVTKDVNEVVELIQEWGFTHDMVPTSMKKNTVIWEALLLNMPMWALLRNLGNMTAVGVFKNDFNIGVAVGKLTDKIAIKKSRINPMNIMLAHMTYSAGKGDKGHNTWKPVPAIIEALDRTFEMSFANVEPLGLKFAFGIDQSGSMGWGADTTSPFWKAMLSAMVLARKEKNSDILTIFFDNKAYMQPVDYKRPMDELIDAFGKCPGGATDTGAFVKALLDKQKYVDVVVIFSDGQSWVGGQHVYQLIEEYRKKINPNLLWISVDVTPTTHSLAPQDDPRNLSVVGFDVQFPKIVNSFLALHGFSSNSQETDLTDDE